MLGQLFIVPKLLGHDVCHQLSRGFLIICFEMHLFVVSKSVETPRRASRTYQCEAFVELALNVTAVLGILVGICLPFLFLLFGI